MADPWRWWDAATIARVTGAQPADVAEHWPLIHAALDARGLWERDIARGVIATIAIETASTFKPVREAFWLPESWRQANLRYYPFYGRGYVQLTWEDAYRIVSGILGVDLLGNPDRAMEPQIAAWITAWFWATKRIPSKDGNRSWTLAELCREQDWVWVRRAVQGGEDGLERLVEIVTALGEEQTTVPTFDPNTPTYLQRNDYTCSIGSIIWMLRSLGIDVAPEDAHDAMVPQYVTTDVGLLDASGAGMVAVLRDRWGVGAVNDANATFDEVAAVAGRQPVAIGLRNWGGPGLGHWSAVRGYRDSGNLELANPAGTGLTFGQQLLNREEFDERGPASMVTVPIGAAPPTTVDPRDARIAELEAQVAELQTIRGHLTVTVAGALQAAVDELKRHAA